MLVGDGVYSHRRLEATHDNGKHSARQQWRQSQTHTDTFGTVVVVVVDVVVGIWRCHHTIRICTSCSLPPLSNQLKCEFGSFVCHQRFICTTNVYAKQPHVVIVMCKRAKLSIFHFIWMLLFIKWNWQQLKNVACRVYSCQRLWSCVTQRANNRHINSIMFICCGSRIDNKTNRIGEFILLLKWVVKRWASHRRRLVISRPTRYAQYGAALLPCSHTNLARRLWQMMDGDNRRTTDSIPRLASYRSRVRWLLYRRAENRLPIKKGNSAICPAIGRNSCTEINRAEIKINRTVLAWIMGIIARQLSW